MNEFFKFRKGKIGLFVLLFILIFSFAPCSSTSYFSPGVVKWSSCGLLNKTTYLLGGYITDVYYLYFGFINLEKNIYFIFIFELIISFILSCIIIYIYNKLKK